MNIFLLIAERRAVKIILFFIFLFLSTSKASAQQLTARQFVEDLEFLKTELPKRHKNLFAKISEQEFNRKIDEIERVSKTLNIENFEIELYKLIKDIGDEHTRIEPTYTTVLPVNFDFFREGIFVTGTDTLHAQLLYKKLTAVEKTSIQEIIKEFEKIVKTDNPSYFDVSFQRFINNPRVLKGMNITQSDSAVNFLLDNARYEIPALPVENFSSKSAAGLLRNGNNDNYWYKLIDDGKILYFNYQECVVQKDKPFETFNNLLWQCIDSVKPKRIILDLRNNSGGNSAILSPFLDKLHDSYLNKKGSLFVLIGKKTFSSALMNAVDLKRNFQSILIGESTSGSVNHYGETRGFRLPNSKIIVGYSTRYWETWKGYKGALRPDVNIRYSIKYFVQNKDEAIEYITSLK